MRISFPLFNTERQHDFVRIYDGQSASSDLLLLEASGGLYYGPYNFSVVSSTNQMLVVFTSDSTNDNRYYSGFYASYSSCTVLTSNNGAISSPNYPDDYNDLDSVCWMISQPDDHVVKLSFNSFWTDRDNDFVRVFDGNSTNSPLLLSVSGNTRPSDVTSSYHQMLVVFSSDDANVRSGFEAIFQSLLLTT